MAAEVPTFYDQWPQRLWMKVTVASSPEETESSLPLSLIRASNSSSGHSSSLTVAICSSSCENLIRQRILIRICLANILWFHILCKQFTFFFFCRAFIASRFRRNFSLCSASLATRRDNNIREMQQKLPLWIFEKRRRLHKDIRYLAFLSNFSSVSTPAMTEPVILAIPSPLFSFAFAFSFTIATCISSFAALQSDPLVSCYKEPYFKSSWWTGCQWILLQLGWQHHPSSLPPQKHFPRYDQPWQRKHTRFDLGLVFVFANLFAP